MISDEYKATLRENHAQYEGYPAEKKWGRSGGRNFGDRIAEFIRKRPEIKTILDFGAGQCSLEAKVRELEPERFKHLVWTNYDPGIEAISTLPPGSFDLIVSSDVLEHIEPERLNEVLKYLYEHNRYYQYHLIACDPCATTLPDGRNAHLIVETPEWWAHKFKDHGQIMYFAHELVRKRRALKTYCCLQIDRSG